MKYLKSFDLVGQSAILLFLLIGGTISVIKSGKIESVAFIGLVSQFFLGCWQMLSAMIRLSPPSNLSKQRFFHFTVAIITVVCFIISSNFAQELGIIVEGIVVISGFIVPWGLAIFYYSITWRTLFPKHHGKFLPHTNF